MTMSAVLSPLRPQMAKAVPAPVPRCVDKPGRAAPPLGVVNGVVTRGLQLGRQLGFPTANIPLAGKLQPRTGVYVVRSRLADGRAFFGVASVGCNPTIPKDAPLLEVCLFDFDEDIYGQTLSTELLAYLREEHRFGSVTALIDQIFADAQQALRYLEDQALHLT